MVVESNAEWQGIFRKGFKRAGFRMLLTEDPGRALSRFRQDATVADCVIFSSQQLGRRALEAFNHFGDDPKTSFVRPCCCWTRASGNGSRTSAPRNSAVP